jgi:hypothetical protein
MPKILGHVKSRSEQQQLRRMKIREEEHKSKFEINDIQCVKLHKLYSASAHELNSLIPIIKKIILHNAKTQELICEKLYVKPKIANYTYNVELYEHLALKYKARKAQTFKYTFENRMKFRREIILNNQLQFNNSLSQNVENSITKLYENIDLSNYIPSETYLKKVKRLEHEQLNEINVSNSLKLSETHEQLNETGVSETDTSNGLKISEKNEQLNEINVSNSLKLSETYEQLNETDVLERDTSNCLKVSGKYEQLNKIDVSNSLKLSNGLKIAENPKNLNEIDLLEQFNETDMSNGLKLSKTHEQSNENESDDDDFFNDLMSDNPTYTDNLTQQSTEPTTKPVLAEMKKNLMKLFKDSINDDLMNSDGVEIIAARYSKSAQRKTQGIYAHVGDWSKSHVNETHILITQIIDLLIKRNTH